MFSNGNSFANGNSHAMSDGHSMFCGERLNTEPFYIRLWSAIQPGAVS